MKAISKTIILVIIVSCCPITLWATARTESTSERNYFQFTVPKYHTTRQSGQTVNIYVRYAYKKKLPTNQYPDYRLLRATVLKYMEPTNEFPAFLFWEILATNMGEELMKKFPLSGVSVQLDVLDNQSSEVFEPGDHGPIFTVGEMLPLDVHH